MIERDLASGYEFIVNQDTAALVVLFWYVLLFEIPRYGLSFLAAAFIPLREARRRKAVADEGDMTPPASPFGRVSVVVVGHSEGGTLERCVRSLRAQSLGDFEIVVVSDGSRDDMVKVGAKLQRAGLIDCIVSTDLRCGKAAGVNLAIRAANGDIVINVDCDCSFDRFAIEGILSPFSDPRVGAVCGDILPRNSAKSLVTAFQTIEYLIGISLGKRAAHMLDQVVCVSGAFGAFRRTALESVGGLDVGGGEDLDLTLRLRARGWRVAFEPNALCYTDVPDNGLALIRQRLRWERDSVRVRFRKHRRSMSPLSSQFRFSEAFHQYDFLIFHIMLGFVFPLYLAYLAVQFGSAGIVILLGVSLVSIVLDTLAYVLALGTTGRWRYLSYALYLPGYGLYAGFFLRAVRLWAYLQEWVFDASRRDSYVPARVSHARHW